MDGEMAVILKQTSIDIFNVISAVVVLYLINQN